MSTLQSSSSHILSNMFLSIVSISAAILKLSASISSGRGGTNTRSFYITPQREVTWPRWTLVHEFCFRVLNHAKLLLYERRTSFLITAEPGCKDIPPILKSLRILLSADNGYMWVCFVVSSYFIPENVSIIYRHSVDQINSCLWYGSRLVFLWTVVS
jgi:hypothetical protein